jgi:hypothetical protein
MLIMEFRRCLVGGAREAEKDKAKYIKRLMLG